MKRAFFAATILAILVFPAFAGNGQYCPESDFSFRIIGNGTAVEIIRYVSGNTDVRIPARIQGLPVTVIGEEAFWGNQLTSVTIPDSVAHIGDFAFNGNRLTSVIIPDSVTHIGNEAFADNGLTSVSISNNVTHISRGAFWNNMLASVIIPDGVTHIHFAAFWANTPLASVIIPDSVTYIGDRTFSGNHITSVSVPSHAQVHPEAFNQAVTVIRR